MQKLCCVRTRQHPLPVWSHKFVLSSTTHISTNSHPFLVGIVSPLGGTKNPLTHYGELTLEHLRAWEGTYLHGMSRAAQDTAHLHLCLMNSLTQAGKEVWLWSDQFILNGRESGILLLKIIIRESHLDTNATTNSIRTQLSNLDEYIITIGCDIIKFNEHVKRLLEQLKARGGETHDLLTNLFKAYTSVKMPVSLTMSMRN